jgi:hypothetical protein
MSGDQLPLFQRKTYKGIIPSIPLEVRVPASDMTVWAALPGYYLYLKEGEFSQYMPDDFTGDVKKFALFLSVCPEMIFHLKKHFGNKIVSSVFCTRRKISLFASGIGKLDPDTPWS